MAILGVNLSDGDNVPNGPDNPVGQDHEGAPDLPASPGEQNREGQTPKGKESLPIPRYRTSVTRYKGIPRKETVGVKCENCPHFHVDHSFYSKLCLIDGCGCTGLKITIG